MYLLGLSGLVPMHKLLKLIAKINPRWDLQGRDPIVTEYLTKIHHEHLGDAGICEISSSDCLTNEANNNNNDSLSRDLGDGSSQAVNVLDDSASQHHAGTT